LRRLFPDAAWARIVSFPPQGKITALTLELQSIVDQKRLKWENDEAPQISSGEKTAAETALYAISEDDLAYSAFPEIDGAVTRRKRGRRGRPVRRFLIETRGKIERPPSQASEMYWAPLRGCSKY
jgi:hypothetical protein